MSAGAPVPLARVMAMAFRALIDDLHERLRARGYANVRSAHGFVLLRARDRETNVQDIAELLGVTKQAASKLVIGMENQRLIKRRQQPEDRRAWSIQIARRGTAMLEAVEEAYLEIEAEWAAIIGRRALERIRADLLRAVGDLSGGELPAIRPVW